jgi:hypothetical protein
MGWWSGDGASGMGEALPAQPAMREPWRAYDRCSFSLLSDDPLPLRQILAVCYVGVK